MAKKKKEIIMQDCSVCNEKIDYMGMMLCSLSLKEPELLDDLYVPPESSIVVSKECVYFRKKK